MPFGWINLSFLARYWSVGCWTSRTCSYAPEVLGKPLPLVPYTSYEVSSMKQLLAASFLCSSSLIGLVGGGVIKLLKWQRWTKILPVQKFIFLVDMTTTVFSAIQELCVTRCECWFDLNSVDGSQYHFLIVIACITRLWVMGSKSSAPVATANSC